MKRALIATCFLIAAQPVSGDEFQFDRTFQDSLFPVSDPRFMFSGRP